MTAKNTNKDETDNPWSNDSSVSFYSSKRNKREELYKSEEYFLYDIIKPGLSILDVGCAAGGFCKIFQEIEPSVKYTGIDISDKLISVAGKNNPDFPFLIGKGNYLPFKDESFDIVFCSGVLHMVFEWQDVINECWRVTKDNLIFDVRLIENGDSISDINRSFQKIAFMDGWDGFSIVPYIILNINDFCKQLKIMNPLPKQIDNYGYFNKISDMTTSPYKEVCMGMWSLRKSGEKAKNKWNLPIKEIEL